MKCATCQHPEAEHVKTTGPNSIGQFWHKGCSHDAAEVPWDGAIALIGGCKCLTYQRTPWWRRLAAHLAGGDA